jgi:itaconate CoA-transferase
VDFELTDEQRLFRQTLRDFADKEIMPVAPEWERTGRYPTEIVARLRELDAVIGGWAAGRPLAECREAAEAAGLGHARLNRPTEVLSHPQLAERGRWQEIGSPVGPVLGLLPPPESADWDWRLDPIPALGEHTEPVLRELGFTAADLAAMRAAGAAGPAPADDGS